MGLTLASELRRHGAASAFFFRVPAEHVFGAASFDGEIGGATTGRWHTGRLGQRRQHAR
jgi:hypothetical protein